MYHTFELIEMWKDLMYETPYYAVGEKEVDTEFFKRAMKETFYYFKEKINFDVSDDKYVLPANDALLYGFVFSYATYSIRYRYGETDIFEASQHAAQMLCDAVVCRDFFPAEGTVLNSDFDYLDKDYNPMKEYYYDVETGDLSELVELIKYMHENEVFPKRFAGMDFNEGSTDTTNPELEKLLTQLRDILEE
ncbi:MAG: hypothetical protein IKL09_03490 [Clostridia bacterium]|nr:hypothetical protein [Clostridia bacterium]